MYVFSVDREGGKVAHVNYIPPSLKAKGGDARVWATKVTDVLGGKVCSTFPVLSLMMLNLFQAGGKEDSAQGVGMQINKVDDALAAAREYLLTL